MIRKNKKFNRPKKAFESGRIAEENEIREKYGLKNKKEIWRALAKVNYFRKRARALANSSMEEQEVLFNKLKSIGLPVTTTADVLGLKPTDLLERRLPTIVFKKGLANTPRHARQLVVHKKVLVNGNIVNSPGYIVPTAFEKSISVKKLKEKAKPKPVEESSENSNEKAEESVPEVVSENEEVKE